MRASLFAAVAVLSLAGAGCEKLFQKDSDRTLDAGDKKAASGDFRMALKFYEAALDGTARTAEVHYKLAMIYNDKLNQPVDALHHFTRYLELAPEGARAKDARAHHKDTSLRLAESLKGGAFITQAESVQLKRENFRLRTDLAQLKAQRNAPAAAQGSGAKAELVQKPIPPGARVYTVKRGDTLGSIAAKFYKNKALWPRIRDANFVGAKGTPPIKAGQQLVIP